MAETIHHRGRLTCDGKGMVRVVGSDGEFTWDACDDCAAERTLLITNYQKTNATLVEATAEHARAKQALRQVTCAHECDCNCVLCRFYLRGELP